MSTAVIVTTYNRPDALAAALDGYFAQDTRDFELLIADDGSTGETRDLIAARAAGSPVPVRHVWQEDLGFRPGAARNRALAATRAEYVIFTDGDCVPATAFVARHRKLAEPGFFLSGSRILLSEAFTTKALRERLRLHDWGYARWAAARLRGDVNRLLPLLTLPDGAFRKWHGDDWRGIKSCNLSAWRADLVRVNGFDESYSGWGLEDSDLVVRLLRAGLRHKNARFGTPLFHLWHRENDRSRLAENQRRLDEVIASPRIEAVVGMNRYQ